MHIRMYLLSVQQPDVVGKNGMHVICGYWWGLVSFNGWHPGWEGGRFACLDTWPLPSDQSSSPFGDLVRS